MCVCNVAAQKRHEAAKRWRPEENGTKSNGKALQGSATHAAGNRNAGAGTGSHSLLSAQKQASVADLGRVLLDLADRYPGIVLTVNGTAVRSLCLNVRVMLGEDTTTSTLDLEVG